MTKINKRGVRNEKMYKKIIIYSCINNIIYGCKYNEWK